MLCAVYGQAAQISAGTPRARREAPRGGDRVDALAAEGALLTLSVLVRMRMLVDADSVRMTYWLYDASSMSKVRCWL